MLLINRLNSSNTATDNLSKLDSNDTIEQINESTPKKLSEEDKKLKFNIQGLFKRLPSFSATTQEGSPKSELPPSTIPQNIMSDINHITIVQSIDEEEEEEPQEFSFNNYEDLNSPITTPQLAPISKVSLFNSQQSYFPNQFSNEERYTSFTSDCISLQNSEMSNHQIEEEPQPQIEKKKKELNRPQPKRNLRSLLRIGSFSSNQNIRTNNPHTAIPKEEEFSESDSESDLEFDPKHEESHYDYKIGGYHPVCKGDIYYSRNFPNREYLIIRKLGWGHFSTVWLAKSRLIDGSNSDEYFVAIKFVKSNKNYKEAAKDEIRILKTLNNPRHSDHLPENYKYFNHQKPEDHPGYNHLMKLLDDFEIIGPNGNHICMVFEILGENVLNLIYKYKKFYKNVNEEIKKKEDEEPMKFNKLDAVTNKKKSNKSMLSLGLSSSTTSTTSSTSSNVSPVMNEDSDSTTTSTTTTIGSWENGIDKKLKSLNSNSLSKIIETSKNCGGIPLNLVKQIVKQMLLAVDYMHHCGIIHTDLKPENILIQIDDINKLVKSIEDKKNSRNNSISRATSLIKKNSFNKPQLFGRTSSSTILQQPEERASSIVSINSQQSFSYRRSKNSIVGKYDSPIRSSKPLCCSTTQDVFFKDVEFDKTKKLSISKAISPKNFSIFDKKQTFVEPTNLSIKIADLGNATYTNEHFTNQIQTRQYRSPEILLKYKSWGSSTDIWSIGCIIFELITGDFLFDPNDGKFFDKDEDHLAQIIELLGNFPDDNYLLDCKLTGKFFKLNPTTKEIVFKNIDNLKFWSLENVLVEKYKFRKDDLEIQLIVDLILKCLKFNIDERFDAASLLKHPWFSYDGSNSVSESDLKNLKNDHDDLPGFTFEE
ncbi:DSK1 [Candida pseudojiufengensis]|uniref:DSK1 n=1 Tax=Candida pseudojiufengensis TaxID=497109 RepID=UPI002224F251|nr:DSK1 [Candida pseudojiufengensis]KAI5960068.1 DSK1 [Candida pseudojiufengensis]